MHTKRMGLATALAVMVFASTVAMADEASETRMQAMEERLEHLLAAAEADVAAVWPEIESELAAARAGLGR